MPPELGFAGSLLDRCANQRSDEAWVAEQSNHPAARLILLDKDKVRVADGRIMFAACEGDAILLGRDDDGAIFAAESPDPLEDARDLRTIAVQSLVPPSSQAILAQARSMLLWHQKHGFCSACGAPTQIISGKLCILCIACFFITQ